MSKTLYIYRRQGLSLPQAGDAFTSAANGDPATAFLFTPERFYLARFAAGQFLNAAGCTLDISQVYEARIFTDKLELRWLNDPTAAKQHRAVILAETDLVAKLRNDWDVHKEDVLETLEQTYLLWGQGTGQTLDGWSTIAMARVGALQVPVSHVPDEANVLLHSIEYLVERDHGNVVVFEERLTGFSINPQK
jgi:CRISPR-associated protein (TIGR03984 family)